MARTIKKRTRSTQGRGDDPRIVTAVSYSRISTYDKCPAQVRFKVEGYDDGSADSEPLKRGKRVHEQGEEYLRGPASAPVPTAYKHFAAEMQDLRAQNYRPEVEICWNRDLEPTGWWDSDIWFRSKIDALKVLRSSADAIDYKTGKEREEHEEQLDAYAVSIFLKFPKVDTVTASMWYLDLGTITSVKYSREVDFKGLLEEWLRRGDEVVSDLEMAPTPSKKWCGWCPFHAKKGGPCRDGA